MDRKGFIRNRSRVLRNVDEDDLKGDVEIWKVKEGDDGKNSRLKLAQEILEGASKGWQIGSAKHVTGPSFDS